MAVRTPPSTPRPTPPAALLAAVFFGGCLGGMSRAVIVASWPTAEDAFPWAVLVINVTGSFLLAALLTVIAGLFPDRTYLRPLLASGFCGAFTTFSAVMASSDLLLAHGHPLLAVSYLGASLTGGLIAAALGLLGGRAVVARPARSVRVTG